MSRTRILGLLLLAAAPTLASAQFDGPAPLAWRWQQFSATAPGGSPLVDGDRIYTAVGSRAYALDRLSGNQLWRFPAAEPIEGNFRTTPVLVDGVLVAASDNKSIYGIDPNTGALKWTYASASPILGAPVAVGKSVAFLLQGNSIQGVNVQTGEALYSAPLLLKDRVAGQIGAAAGNVIYFTQDSQLKAFDFNTQKPVWGQRFAQLPQTVRPIVVGDSVYTYSGQYLVSLLAASGSPRFQVALPERPFSAPVVGAGGVLVVTDTGRGYFYDPTGRAINRKPLEIGSSPIVPPSAAGTKFIVPTANGAVNLVDPKGDAVLWSFVIRPASEGLLEATTPPVGGGGVGGRGGGGIGRQQAAPREVTAVPASASAVLAGTTLLVPARDGSLLAFDRQIGVDLTPPDVRILWPAGGDDVSGQAPLELIFKVTDEASGLKLDTIVLDIDGVPYETTFDKAGFLIAKVSLSGKNKPLANGRRLVTVTASDWMGNVAKKAFTLNVDNSLKPLVRPTGDTPAGGQGRPGGLGGGGRNGGGGGGFGGGDGR